MLSHRLVAAGAACAALGAGVLVKASAAPRPGGKRVVHSETVVVRRDGTVARVTVDRGRLVKVTGRTLVIDERYRTLSVTLPADARVRIRRTPAALSDLRAGQPVRVRQAPRRTVVVAR